MHLVAVFLWIKEIEWRKREKKIIHRTSIYIERTATTTTMHDDPKSELVAFATFDEIIDDAA